MKAETIAVLVVGILLIILGIWLVPVAYMIGMLGMFIATCGLGCVIAVCKGDI